MGRVEPGPQTLGFTGVSEDRCDVIRRVVIDLFLYIDHEI